MSRCCSFRPLSKEAHGHRKKHGGHHARILQTRKRLSGFRSEAHAGGVRARNAQPPALPAGDARDRAHPDERDRDPEWVAGRDGGDAEARRPGAGRLGPARARRHPGSQPFHLEHRLLPRARPLQQPRPVPGRHVSGPGPRRILGGQRQRHRVHLPPAQGRHFPRRQGLHRRRRRLHHEPPPRRELGVQGELPGQHDHGVEEARRAHREGGARDARTRTFR